MESSISVAVRVRPFNEKERPLLAPVTEEDPFLGDGGFTVSAAAKHKRLRSIISVLSDRVLVFDPPDREALKRLRKTSPGICRGTRPNKDVRYAFDSVWTDTASQQQIYAGTVEPLLQGVMTGYNATVFAYGATGCGKTHTISGTPEDPGLIFLAMRDLFQRTQDEADDKQIVVKISYLEIYNEQIRDLLSPEPTPPGQGLQLRDSVGGRQKISVVGLTEHTPRTPQEVLEMITEGNRRRTMSPTEANAVSSRSHAVLQVNVMQRPKGTGLTEECTSASLNIIDLAGSERASATRNRGQRMMEGANINRSLLALANCINALCRPAAAHGQIHIPYRDSKLTRLLKFSLGGNCRTVMIVCVSPSSAHFEETQKTLKYAASAKSIRTKVSQNLINVDRHVESYAKAILELQAQNQRLKKLLEEGKSLGSEAEQRKKTELAELVRQAKAAMQDAASAYLSTVWDKAVYEAQIDAAKQRLAFLRAQMAQRRANPSAAQESEMALLSSALAQQESVLSDKGVTAALREMQAALASFHASLQSASRNARFDTEAREALQTWAAKLQAEGEAAWAKAKYEALLQLLSQPASGWVDGRATPSGGLASVAGPLRSLAEENGQASPPLLGPAPAAPAPLPVGRPGSLRTAGGTHHAPSAAAPAQPSVAHAAQHAPRAGRMSISGKRMVASMGRGGGSTTRRVSTGPRIVVAGSPKRASYAAATAASRTRRVGHAESPRQARRGSVKPMRRPSKEPARKRVSAGHAAQRMPAVPKAAPVPERRKVSLRWKDLAGEGELEERFSPDQSAAPPAPPDVEMGSPDNPPAHTHTHTHTHTQPPLAHALDLSPTKSVAAKRLRPTPKAAPTEPSGGVLVERDEPPTTLLLSPAGLGSPAAPRASCSPSPPQAMSLDERPLRALHTAPQARGRPDGTAGESTNASASIFATLAKERDALATDASAAASAPNRTGAGLVRGPPGNAAARAMRTASFTRR